MSKPRILFVSGSIGLGHISRDLAIARELRRHVPDLELQWLAAHPASLMIHEAAETLVPEASGYSNDSDFAEQSARGCRLNLIDYLMKAREGWAGNMRVFADIVNSRHFDLVIGDETYEIVLSLKKHPERKRFRFVMMYDFVGLDAMTGNPVEKMGVYFWNWIWSRKRGRGGKPTFDVALFVGEPEDVPDKPFGFLLPNRRQYADAMYRYIGYVLPFDPSALPSQAELRRKLGYSSDPLVVVSIGGTSIGKGLLELCGEASTLVRARMPSLHMVVAAGPRMKVDSLRIPKEVEVREFVPRLYEHFAACDLAIVLGGATSTLELTALQRPFLYFPIEGHSEQANVARILARHRAGVQMSFSRTTPASLADAILRSLDTKVSYAKIPVDGAQRAVHHILQLLYQD
jgi:predicted glycosyltransferase